ncbi:MAG: hypothetical protein AB8G11_16955 [Saprospiraceae bacterium]
MNTTSMKLSTKSLKQAIDRHYRKEKVHPQNFESFVEVLDNYLFYTERAKRVEETNENIQTYSNDFLSFFFPNVTLESKIYIAGYYADLVISTTSNVEVLMEIEIEEAWAFSIKKWNQPSFYRLLTNYLFERIEYKNNDLKYLIINTIDSFYIFDASDFERLFPIDEELVEQFMTWRNSEIIDQTTKKLYTYLNKIIAKATKEISVIQFNINDYQEAIETYRQEDFVTALDKKNATEKLIEIYKIFSPKFLLKQSRQEDISLFNEAFYYELLYILGLEEQRIGTKKIIARCATPQIGSLLENVIVKLKTEDLIYDLRYPEDYGETEEEQYFNVALSLLITWLNRILFLKILEAQLVAYNVDDTDKDEFRFLHPSKIDEFDTLNTLFFEVMAIPEKKREKHISKQFGRIPFLNSSLFEVTDLERQTLRLSNIKDSTKLPLYKDSEIRSTKSELGTLDYLLQFLEAYDFGLSASESVLRLETKPVINTATLGLSLERLSGYRAGAFYTPNMVTKYMSRDVLHRNITQKFAIEFGERMTKFEDVKRFCQNLQPTVLAKANEIVNSITICDASVGAGQFLVAALNELLVIKSELGILCDVEGLSLKDNISLKIENDELVIYDKLGLPFSYKLSFDSGFRQILPELQRIQEAIFREKKQLIEHSLFGVDINPNSVKICRLRLWLELLKSAYYRQRRNTQLETLPNIDINIKTGNSLISRFGLEADLDEVFRRTEYSVEEYKRSVKSYKTSENKREKRQLTRYLNEIKDEFQITFNKREKEKIAKVRGKKDALELQIRYNRNLGYEPRASELEDLEKLTASLQRRQAEKEIMLTSGIYNNAFEWRFEFPEVLDENGNFIGFDVVIGQPTTMAFAANKEAAKFYKKLYSTYTSGGKLYQIFFELGLQILKKSGFAVFFTPNAWLKTQLAQKTRNIIDSYNPLQILYFGKSSFQDKQMKNFAITMIQNQENNGEVSFVDLSDSEDLQHIIAIESDVIFRNIEEIRTKLLS